MDNDKLRILSCGRWEEGVSINVMLGHLKSEPVHVIKLTKPNAAKLIADLGKMLHHSIAIGERNG